MAVNYWNLVTTETDPYRIRIILPPTNFAVLTLDVTCSSFNYALKPSRKYIIFPLPQGFTEKQYSISHRK